MQQVLCFVPSMMCNTDAQAFRNALGHREFLCPAQKSQILRVLLLLFVCLFVVVVVLRRKRVRGRISKKKAAAGRKCTRTQQQQHEGEAYSGDRPPGCEEELPVLFVKCKRRRPRAMPDKDQERSGRGRQANRNPEKENAMPVCSEIRDCRCKEGPTRYDARRNICPIFLSSCRTPWCGNSSIKKKVFVNTVKREGLELS